MDPWPLEIDLQPFNREFPRLRESRSIGHGVSFLNRRLSSTLSSENAAEMLIGFLRVHHFRGQQYLLPDTTPADTRALRQPANTSRASGPASTWRRSGV